MVSKAKRRSVARLRICIGEHTDLRVSWQALSNHGTVDIGQTVCVTIPEEAVHLEVGGFRRWHTTIEPMVWTGRVGESEG